ncbi:MarR family winged helix-turn-helix transcriptional regulator [Salinarimonas rosea]|uniref:MarR family winged helix-turn-helix transcriptional regulator n=1 Tax=Salinarimonas rosea TaxID=552063 RepID=UPI000420C555|nr:MarR family winged helix-turn-helix transcriptional regulator [Salinarimonas rosea]
MTRRADAADDDGSTRESGAARRDPAPDDPAFRLETQVGHLIRRVHQRNTEIFNTVMSRFSVTPTQFAALVTLLERGATPQNQLGRLTAMDPATIFGVVGRLMKRGFVRQSPVSADARLVAVSLTPEGERAARAMRAVAQEVSTRTLEPLSEEEARTFLAFLQRLG